VSAGSLGVGWLEGCRAALRRGSVNVFARRGTAPKRLGPHLIRRPPPPSAATAAASIARPEIRGGEIVCGYNSRLCKRLQDFSREKIMPIYAYRCESCGFGKDVLQKMSDPQLTQCPECGKDSFRKQVTAAGFQLKGSGWYVTDFRGGNSGAGAPAKPDANAASNGGSGESAATANGGGAKSDTASANGAAAAGSSSAAATPAAPAAAPAATSGAGSA